MVLKSIVSIFSTPKTRQAFIGNNPIKESEIKSIEEYFQEELDKSPYFRVEFKHRVLEHLLHKVSLTKTGNALSLDEKKSLGLNPKLAMTKELVEVLSEEGIALANPKLLLEEIYNRATISKARFDEFERARKLGVTKFKLLPSGDGSECGWCTKKSKQELGVDALEQMKLHCRCEPYSKCSIIAKLDL